MEISSNHPPASLRLLLALALTTAFVSTAGAALIDVPVAAVLEAAGADGRPRIVEPSEVLCSGEAFLVRVAVKKRSFVALVFGRRRPGGVHVEQIYPSSGMAPLQLDPGRWHSLPLDTSMILDETKGIEHLFVIASDSHLPRSATEKLVRQAMQTATDPLPARERTCDSAPPALNLAPAGTMEHYRDIAFRQKLPHDALDNAQLVRISIIHR